jgi:phage tail-like protein
MARNDPLRNFRFRLEIDNLTVAGFSEVAIAETMIEAIDYREGTDPPHVRKLSGLTKYGNITLKYGISVGTGSLDLFKWHKAVSEGEVLDQRKHIKIVVLDEAGQDKTRFVVSEAWPVKYDPSDLNAKGNEVLIELLEFVNEGIERQNN